MQPGIDALNAVEGLDVHHPDAKTGRVIVTQEAEHVGAEVDGLKRIKAMPEVLMAELVSHFFEEDEMVINAIPPGLDELDGLQQANVTARLNS